jgi:glycosyltransferase involved in cell wall biosynthesis
VIAIVASTFPRFAGDAEPAFILDLAREIARMSDVKVFVPAHPRSDDTSGWAGVPVERFHYFPAHRQETLCGDGGIPAKISTMKGRVLLPFLVAAEIALFARLLRDPAVRVIHAHWLLPQGLALAVARARLRKSARSPLCVLSLHSGRGVHVSKSYRSLERWILRRFDRVTVNNEKTRTLLEREHARPIAYLSMGLPHDVEALPLPARKDYTLLASVGRLVPVKGYLELVQAWARRRDALRGYSLVILGKGALASDLDDAIRRHGLADRIRVYADPTRASILQTLAQAGYYLQPSRELANGQTEGFGLAVLEAMHLGCTAMVSAAGGLPEVVGDAGYLCADAEEMLDRLVQGRVPPRDPAACRAHAHRFAWSAKDLGPLYA